MIPSNFTSWFYELRLVGFISLAAGLWALGAAISFFTLGSKAIQWAMVFLAFLFIQNVLYYIENLPTLNNLFSILSTVVLIIAMYYLIQHPLNKVATKKEDDYELEILDANI